MSRNVTISVPDGLGMGIDKWRNRMNISRICTKAIEAEIAMLEGWPYITPAEIQEVIQRLELEKERLEELGRSKA